MSSAKVILKTNDVIARVPAFPGVSAAICIPAKRGPVGTPVLCSGEADILSKFTERGRIEVGYDLAYFSAVTFQQKSSKLWVVRPDNGSEYGGFRAFAGTATLANSGVPTSVNLVDPQSFVFDTDQAFLIYGANPGAWNNGLSIALVDNSTKEPGSFYVDVYQNNVRVEHNLVSRVMGAKDGMGRNIYIEDALESSEFIRALDNPALAPSTAIKFNSVAVAMTNGDDGDPVTDGMMITALQDLRDKEGYSVTLLLDGGRATPEYAQALVEIAEERNDTVALLSVPYAAESNADYMNEILDYVNTTLNINSSCGAIYSPHVLVYDRFNDRRIYVSPEAYAGAVISETADNYEIFFAPAGDNAAVNVLDVRRRFKEGERDVLADARVNPLRFTLGKGIRIWGQKTLLARDGYLTRLNVKFLMVTIEPAIMSMLDGFTFQFNDESTRAVIKAKIDAYMDTIVGRRGAVWYETICDVSNNPPAIRNQNLLQVQLNVEPNQAGEIINFTRQLSSKGEVTVVASRS